MTNQSDRSLWVQIPESLYDRLIDLAWDKRNPLRHVIPAALERKLTGRIVWPIYVMPSTVADLVQQTRDHEDTACLQPFFDDWPREEGWYVIAHILADEVRKLERLNNRVVGAIRAERVGDSDAGQD